MKINLLNKNKKLIGIYMGNDSTYEYVNNKKTETINGLTIQLMLVSDLFNEAVVQKVNLPLGITIPDMSVGNKYEFEFENLQTNLYSFKDSTTVRLSVKADNILSVKEVKNR